MQYQCIRCDTVWGEKHPNDRDDYYSHGLCKCCLVIGLTPIYRGRQIKEGNPDCFAKATNYCDQDRCCYRLTCLL